MEPKMQYRPPKYEAGPGGGLRGPPAIECHVSHSYWRFSMKVLITLTRAEERLNYVAIFPSLSQAAQTGFRMDWFKKEVCLYTRTEKNASFRWAWER